MQLRLATPASKLEAEAAAVAAGTGKTGACTSAPRAAAPYHSHACDERSHSRPEVAVAARLGPRSSTLGRRQWRSSWCRRLSTSTDLALALSCPSSNTAKC